MISVAQFTGGGGAGMNRILGGAPNAATPFNAQAELSGRGGAMQSMTPSISTPRPIAHPTPTPSSNMSSGSRMGRGMMPATELRM
jgi:hypothetical protein